jgi:peptidoglycan/xylan/chitin deacetylase (PgdA/CDA1 family)
MGAMWRALLIISATGKAVAALLWAYTSWHWAAAGFFFLPDLFIFYQIFVPSAGVLCPVRTRFETSQPEIWLTIDDGPDEEDTPRILDLLDRHRARATFFLIGERAERYPHLVSEILRRGHQVGHHTHTHPMTTFWCASPRRVRAELDACLAALGRAGARPSLFRAPVGIKNLFLADELNRRGLTCVGWSVRSLDSVSRDPARVAARVIRSVRPGSIVLMHEGAFLDARVRVHALGLLLDQLDARRMACVHPSADQMR